VVLTAWNGKYPAGVACTTVVSVIAQPIHYVKASNATPVYPYTNWATAATSIQQAIDASSTAGRLVLVTNGVYLAGGKAVYGTMLNRVILTNGVTVCSVNGPAVTAIQGAGPRGDSAVRCAYVGKDCVLTGFTLTNGFTRGSGDEIKEKSGGGVWCEVGAVVSNCTLICKTVGYNAGYGGGAYGGTLKQCTLTGGYVPTSGGGAYGAFLINCMVTNNSCANWGGGVGWTWLKNCTLVGNSADGGGGGADYSTLNNCTLIGNYARNLGGGASRSTVNNCTLTGNSVQGYGGGTYQSIVNNCTLTRNLSSNIGGGSYLDTLHNCIVYYNMAPTDPNWSGGSLSYCCTMPVASGTGNIADEPCLITPTYIAPDSPCVGKGSTTYASGVDVDGEVWRNPPSIGADEPYSVSATGSLAVAIEAPFTETTRGYELPFTAKIQGRVTRSVWDFGDGSLATNKAYASHAWTALGKYNVVLTAWNADCPDGLAVTAIVSVVAQSVCYVKASNATPVYPYTNWATAATSIQQAIDADSTAGRLVLVADGVYEVGSTVVSGAMKNRVTLRNGVTVRSVNGPEVTIIKGNGPIGTGAVRCAYVGNDCVLSGFTLTNGATLYYWDLPNERSGGGVWCDVRGLVSNCMLTGNSSASQGGGAYGGTLKNCTITGNSSWAGGGAFYCVLENCLLNRNTATDYGGVYVSTLKNCAVIANCATNTGGGAYGSTLNNCTLAGNSAGVSGGGVLGGVMNNCIVYDNVAPINANFSGGSWSYSCTTPLPGGGVGIITNAPAFRDAANENCRLSAQSPCINAGQNQAWMFNAVDLDGKPRIRNGTVDMGAYEVAFLADMKGLLQGPFSTNTHVMTRLANKNLPTRSPYAADTRRVATIPSNTVDWAHVEVQDTNRIAVASMSVFLDPTGLVLDASGVAGIPVEVSVGSYYLVLKHRNHLAVVSAQPVAFTNMLVAYDFTTGPDKCFGGTNACVELEPGVWGLISGDADGDGRITPVDRIIVERQKGMTGYLQGDLNLDGTVDGEDQ
jgi:hypothetical protein